ASCGQPRSTYHAGGIGRAERGQSRPLLGFLSVGHGAEQDRVQAAIQDLLARTPDVSWVLSQHGASGGLNSALHDGGSEPRRQSLSVSRRVPAPLGRLILDLIQQGIKNRPRERAHRGEI